MRDKKIKLVNKILKEAFGRRTIGNYFPDAEVKMCGEKRVRNQLEAVIKKSIFYIPGIWESYTLIGEFLPDSGKYKLGSKIEVLPEYKEGANVYASLYNLHKAEFKRNASVSIKGKKE